MQADLSINIAYPKVVIYLEGIIYFSGFFAILHSWFNAFAEMLRFADRMFYKVQ